MSTTNETDTHVQTAFRLPASVIDRIDAQVTRLRRRHPGVRFTRSDVVRQLLQRALADAERER
ncbi:MAG TPA: hypothetical protein VJT85_00050 [Gemmatimonadaceae bacterium]|nr:hypothetical protein [Gemmatimonadaceae bacterium]